MILDDQFVRHENVGLFNDIEMLRPHVNLIQVTKSCTHLNQIKKCLALAGKEKGVEVEGGGIGGADLARMP